MKTDKLEKYLDELSEGTDFDFRISEIKNGEVELYMQGDNPCNEDWCTEITIKNPKTKRSEEHTSELQSPTTSRMPSSA